MKKFLALVLSLCMVFSLAAVASAAELTRTAAPAARRSI